MGGSDLGSRGGWVGAWVRVFFSAQAPPLDGCAMDGSDCVQFGDPREGSSSRLIGQLSRLESQNFGPKTLISYKKHNNGISK